jgi:predicted RNA-binding protein YlxR (DUF448 family)
VIGARTDFGALPAAAADDVVRRCAVERVEKNSADLIRFVRGPDGRIVPDLARRLPGRGVWVTARREAIAAAVKRQVFAHSLRCQVEVPLDLPEMVGRLLVRRLAEALGLANKAGTLVTGFAKVDMAISTGAAYILVHASDAAVDGIRKLDARHRARSGPHAPRAICELTGAELSLALGRPNVVHAALAESGTAQRAMSEAERLRRFQISESVGLESLDGQAAKG